MAPSRSPDGPPQERAPDRTPDRARRRALFRGLLGLAQMTGACVALAALGRSGVTPLALGVVAATSALTAASVLLFDRPRG